MAMAEGTGGKGEGSTVARDSGGVEGQLPKQGLRKVPILHRCCQAWFGVCCLFGMTVCYALIMSSEIIFRRQEKLRKEERACVICHFCFRYLILLPCPWIRLRQLPSEEEWASLADRDRVLLCINHRSFLDSILVVALCPPRILRRYRTLMKASLFKVPLLGSISKAVGHFPVHFITEEYDEFKVQKDVMEEVMRGVGEHVSRGGGLSVYPEGRINIDPGVDVLPFRRGIFGLALKKQMHVVCLTLGGSREAWPREEAVGGLPSDVSLRLDSVKDAGVDGSEGSNGGSTGGGASDGRNGHGDGSTAEQQQQLVIQQQELSDRTFAVMSAAFKRGLTAVSPTAQSAARAGRKED